jgi:AICAR transformylase/IMP cyclohydrolase PurH
LCAKVFDLTSTYDTAISQWLNQVKPDTDPYFRES